MTEIHHIIYKTWLFCVIVTCKPESYFGCSGTIGELNSKFWSLSDMVSHEAGRYFYNKLNTWTWYWWWVMRQVGVLQSLLPKDQAGHEGFCYCLRQPDEGVETDLTISITHLMQVQFFVSILRFEHFGYKIYWSEFFRKQTGNYYICLQL